MSYPQQLKAMATRLSNYSSTIRKVSPQGKDNGYVAGDVARFLLPSNTMVDFRTLTMHFTGSTKADAACDGKGAVLFPSLTSSLIDQIVISAGGVQIEATPRQWGQLAKMLDDFTAGTEKRRARTLLNNERMAGLDSKTGDFFSIANLDRGVNDDENYDLVDAYPTLTPGNRETNRRFAIDEWPGCFLGTVNPSVISTALTGDIMLEFRFAPNSVLASVGVGGLERDPAASGGAPVQDGDGDLVMREADDEAVGYGAMKAITEMSKPASPSYVLDDLHLSIKTIDISDGQFYEWLKAEVTAEPLAMPFQHFVVQPGQTTAAGSAAQTTRMTVNSSSVDYLLGTFVPADFEEGTLLPKAERAYNMTKPKRRYYTIPKQYLTQGTFGNTQTSRYFQRGGVDISKPFESAFSVNNVLLDYPCDLPTVWCKVKDEFNLGKTQGTNMNPRLQKLAHFAQGFFVVPQRLNFNTGEADNSRILSGLDSRNATTNIQWKTTGTLEDGVKVGVVDQNNPAPKLQVIPMLYAATTAVLRVSEGRVLDLVY
jgi:hypothetical protein